MSNITTQIRDRALAARISIRELMRRAGVAENNLRRWEQSVDTPNAVTLGKVMDALEAAERERSARVAARFELLGAIVYIAGAIVAADRASDAAQKTESPA